MTDEQLNHFLTKEWSGVTAIGETFVYGYDWGEPGISEDGSVEDINLLKQSYLDLSIMLTTVKYIVHTEEFANLLLLVYKNMEL